MGPLQAWINFETVEIRPRMDTQKRGGVVPIGDRTIFSCFTINPRIFPGFSPPENYEGVGNSIQY